MESPFVFAICQEGAEVALKNEIARIRPTWRSSYSRPGFVTWKCGEKPAKAGESLGSVFARAWSLSVGKAENAEDAWKKMHAAFTDAAEDADGKSTFGAKPPYRLHVSGVEAESLREKILAQAPTGTFFPEAPAEKKGEGVFTLHSPREGETWIGFHLHSDAHSPDPGGDPGVVVPEGAPSRAYAKIAEAARYPGFPLQKGDAVLEIGSAPGGMSFYLLERGCRIVGVDPAEMDPAILKDKRFTHLKKPVAATRIEDVGPGAQWIVVDLKLVPNIALDQTERFVRLTKPSLFGVVLTLKFNDATWKERVPELLERVRQMGMERVRGIQLPANRSEFTVVGLTSAGLKRQR